MNKRLNPSDHAGVEPELLAGNRRAIARTISRVERGEVDLEALSQTLAPHLGRAHVVGITGALCRQKTNTGACDAV